MDPTEPARGRRIGQGGEPWLAWTRRRHVWTSNVEDYTITYLGGDEYELTHRGESVVAQTFVCAVLVAEMARALEDPS